jgi:hypothetical protein
MKSTKKIILPILRFRSIEGSIAVIGYKNKGTEAKSFIIDSCRSTSYLFYVCNPYAAAYNDGVLFSVVEQ